MAKGYPNAAQDDTQPRLSRTAKRVCTTSATVSRICKRHLLPAFGAQRLEGGVAQGRNRCEGVEPFEDHDTKEVRRRFDELDRNRNVQVGQVIRLLRYTGARKRAYVPHKLDSGAAQIPFPKGIVSAPS